MILIWDSTFDHWKLELYGKYISKSPQPPFAKGGRGGIYDFHISWMAKSAMGNLFGY